MQAVLHLIRQKGLNKQCKKLQKGIKGANIALEALKLKSIGPRDLSSREAQDDLKDELKLTKELAQLTLKHFNEAMVNTYELLCNLLAGEPQT